MTATDQNFNMHAGDTNVLTYTVRDEDGVVLDISNAVIKWVMYDKSGIIVTKDNDAIGGVALSDPINGVFTVTLSPATTLSLGGRTFFCEAEATDILTNVSTVAVGMVCILESLA